MHTHPKFASLQEEEARLLLPTYERNPLLFTRGEGVYLFDVDENAYLDCLSGIGVCALGYGHPAVTAAIERQAHALLHTSNLFFHEHTAELARRLTDITGMDRAFFCNSGSEAWEAALKLARAHARRLRDQGRMGTRILCLEHSFHGRTMGSVSTTHKNAYREPFNPLVPGVEFIPFNDVTSLREAFNADPSGFCAVAFEVLQGEGGINLVSSEFLHTARDLCTETGALLMLDEIQSGMGRTGKWTAYQHFGVLPDVTTLAKPLANGVPIGAMLCTEVAARAIRPGMHGTTFGGNPLACAVAISVVDTLINDNLLNHTAEAGAYFQSKLRDLQTTFPEQIKDVRGLGLMIGCELVSEELARQVLQGMLERRIIVNRTHNTVLRFLPPYLITTKQIDLVVNTLHTLLQAHQEHALPLTQTAAAMPEDVVHD